MIGGFFLGYFAALFTALAALVIGVILMSRWAVGATDQLGVRETVQLIGAVLAQWTGGLLSIVRRR